MTKIIIVDIDQTICTTPNINGKNCYEYSVPNFTNIFKVNKLYDQGYKIIYWTARGMSTGNIPRDLTIKQLNIWKVKYHELRFEKPSYDYWIDDKAINALDFMKDDYDNLFRIQAQ